MFNPFNTITRKSKKHANKQAVLQFAWQGSLRFRQALTSRKRRDWFQF